MNEGAGAPGDLAVVQALLNTRNVEADTEELTSPAALDAWLADHDLLPAGTTVTATDLARVQAFREALREVLLARHDGEDPPPAARAALDEVARRAPLKVHLDATGTTLEPLADGVDAVLARVLAVVHAAAVAGTWVRLKVCRNTGCQWAYYDTSRNQSRKWCSMAVCGNRDKAQRYRERHLDT